MGGVTYEKNNLTDMNFTSVDEIDNEIKKKEMKIKMNKEININKSNKSNKKNNKKKYEKNYENDEDDEKHKKRIMILNLAKMAAKKGIEIDGFGKNKKYKKDKNKKKSNTDKNKKKYDSDKKIESEEYNYESENKYLKEKIIIKPKNEKCSSDFLFELPKYINKIKSFELVSYNLPETTLINYSDNTEINITVIDNNGKRNEITTNINYDRDKVINEIFCILRDELNKYDIDINMIDGILSINHIKNHKIKIENDINSIFRLFGFIKSEYINKTEYTSDNKIEHKNAYLFLYKIINDGPFAKLIEGNNNCEITKIFENPTKIRHMIFQIKKTNDINSDLFDFQGNIPEFVFEFTYI